MEIEFSYQQLQDFLDTVVPPRPEELVRMEEYARQHAFPIIGPVAGQLCYQTARMIGAKRVFEMGSGYGYSTAWFARAVQENGGGEVHHVVWDERLSESARRHLNALGYGSIVRYHVAEAVELLRHVAGPFDLIFLDIDKETYPMALPVITPRLRTGGLLIIDNILWHGQIFDEQDRSPANQGVRTLTRMLATDPAWIVSVLPLRDGLLVAMKR